jgi:site-specific DNA-methyltransferase (adenine-specific)
MELKKIYNGDCFEIMKTIEENTIDLVLTDPPFGMSFQSNHRKEKHKKIENDDNLDWLLNWVNELKRIVKDDSHLYIFCSWHKVDIFKSELEKHFKIKNILIWEKNNTGMGDLEGDYAPKYEMIIFCSNGVKKLKGRRDSNIVKAKKTANINHPTEKPINLMEYFIEKSSNKGDVVFDSFAGGGSTLIAAEILDRNYIGIELDKDYFNIINKRLSEHKSQIRMF